MKLLAIDTSTAVCSVALMVDAELQERHLLAPRGHAEHVLRMIDELLAQFAVQKTALDAIAFGKGPGSFTGLRIAAGITQGIALALDLPVLAVSSLQALAQTAYNHYQQPHILAALDARMQEVYFACYHYNASKDIMEKQGAEIVSAPAIVPLPKTSQQAYLAAGNGWGVSALQQRCQTVVDKIDIELYPSATAIASLAQYYSQQGQAITAFEIVSSYIRNNVVN